MAENDKLDLILAELKDVKRSFTKVEIAVAENTKRLTSLETKVTSLEDRVTGLETRLERVEAGLEEVKEETKENSRRLTNLEAVAESHSAQLTNLEAVAEKHYRLSLDFYGRQMEANTELAGRFKVIEGRQEIHENQIARNTAELRRIG